MNSRFKNNSREVVMKYVIIGGSAAGIAAAAEIRKVDSKGELTIICKDKFYYSRCQLHMVASGKTTVEQIRLKPTGWAEAMGIKFMSGKTVFGLDTTNRTVTLDDDQTVAYDRLLIATGTKTFFPPNSAMPSTDILLSSRLIAAPKYSSILSVWSLVGSLSMTVVVPFA